MKRLNHILYHCSLKLNIQAKIKYRIQSKYNIFLVYIFYFNTGNTAALIKETKRRFPPRRASNPSWSPHVFPPPANNHPTLNSSIHLRPDLSSHPSIPRPFIPSSLHMLPASFHTYSLLPSFFLSFVPSYPHPSFPLPSSL